MAPVWESSQDPGTPAVHGENTAGGRGVEGFSQTGQAVYGESTDQAGVVGVSENFVGVWGESRGGHAGVIGKSTQWSGVVGESVDQSGVAGVSENFVGVWGESRGGHAGVLGKSTRWSGVVGESVDQSGVAGISENFVGVWAETKTTRHAALFAKGAPKAGVFEGDVEVTGDIRLTNADCAEDFTIGPDLSVDPGTVMVLGEEGVLYPSQNAYDKRVVGVVSGAGDCKPGIILDRQEVDPNRQPIALLGKVYCKADAHYGAIEVGDLLTTSFTPGHAMKAADPMQAFGAVIGKALRPIREGRGLIPILIALQ